MLSSDYGVWAWEIEGTYGTDAVQAKLAADEAIVYQRVNAGSSITPVAINFRPDRHTPGQNGTKSSFIEQMSNFSLQVPILAGVGTPNTPAASALLKACGFSEDIDTADTTYTLQSVLQPGFSLWHWKPILNTSNHRLIRTYGALGNISVSAAVGEEVVAAVEGMGIAYEDWSATAAYFSSAGNPILDAAGAATISTATMDASERLLCRSATITYDGTSIPVSSWTINAALGVEAIQVQTAEPTGVRIIRSGREAANVALSFESTDALAAYDKIVSDAGDNDVATLTMVMLGATKKLTITARIQFQQRPAERENAGLIGWDATAILVDDSATHPFGQNSLTFVYAAI